MRIWKPDKKFCILLFLSFAAGAAIGFFLIRSKTIVLPQQAVVFGNYYLRQYARLDIDKAQLGWQIAKERGKWLLLLWALGFTWAGGYFVYIFCGIWGLFYAVLTAAAFGRMGIPGLGLLLLSGVPQILIYIPLWLWFLSEVQKKSRLCREVKKTGAVSGNNRKYLAVFLAGGGVLFLGILTESYVNSWILQQVLRSF